MILSRTVSCYLVLIVTGIITAVGHARRHRPCPVQEAPNQEEQAA